MDGWVWHVIVCNSRTNNNNNKMKKEKNTQKKRHNNCIRYMNVDYIYYTYICNVYIKRQLNGKGTI